jgi:hypothetical protein
MILFSIDINDRLRQCTPTATHTQTSADLLVRGCGAPSAHRLRNRATTSSTADAPGGQAVNLP